MIYLNEGFEGGETNFYSDGNRFRFGVRPRTGSALLFVHNLFHEGARVVSGRKYVMRSDVMYRQVRYQLSEPDSASRAQTAAPR